MEQFSVDAYKIASADMNYYELIKNVAESNKPILISTGMATDKQIREVIKFTKQHTSKYIFMHCTSVYPAEDQEINLKFMRKIQDWSLGNPVGYSGHETDLLPSLIASINGARVIERHLTLDKSAKGSDHAASLYPTEFAELIKITKRSIVILGNGVKQDLSEKLIESKNKLSKSLYTNKVILKGSRITMQDLVVKSPGGGLEPNQVKLILGKKARSEMSEEHQISLSDFE
jgi:N-acetylneuraminate synthase